MTCTTMPVQRCVSVSNLTGKEKAAQHKTCDISRSKSCANLTLCAKDAPSKSTVVSRKRSKKGKTKKRDVVSVNLAATKYGIGMLTKFFQLVTYNIQEFS